MCNIIMAESEEDLLTSIKSYEDQLSKVAAALQSASTYEEKEELTSLKDNISELLSLTVESLDALKGRPKNEECASTSRIEDDPFAAEYALFKAEVGEDLEDSKASSTNEDGDAVDIQNELDEIVGSKCQAPFTNPLGSVDYYNALVFSVDVSEDATDISDIKVKVMFINPTEKVMIPCPFYLDGNCKFSDSKCNFSHGYIVGFSQLKEYKEPDFNLIKPGCRVLAKPAGSQLWISTKVIQVLSDDVCSIKHAGIIKHVPIGDIFPLEASQGTDSDLSEDENFDEIRSMGNQHYEEILEKSFASTPSQDKLGSWEQHTKGVGSKIMAKMGYIVGTGLGKQGEGRIEPVQALILPPGKSLDHCMKLREAAGGSKDLFSAEKIQKKLALKLQRQSMRQYKKKKEEEEKHNVFNLINNTLSTGKSKMSDETKSGIEFSRKLASVSDRSLNIQKLKNEETMEQMKREIYILSDKLSLKKEGSIEYKNIAMKLIQEKDKLEKMQRRDGKLAWEINARDTKKKMTF